MTAPQITRRRALLGATGGVLAAGGAGLELVAHGVLPGKRFLNQIDGACNVTTPPETSVTSGPSHSGSFFSRARGQTVGYTIAYPPGHGPGDRLALTLVLHAFGGNHTSGYCGLTLAAALATTLRGQPPRAPMALAAADGGPLYWNPHPGDDPLAMLTDELIPLCARLGLGSADAKVGVTGISMGGYGSLLLAERHPERVLAVAAISPAIWTSYDQAHAANAGAYASPQAFAADDLLTHAGALREIPTRVASGQSDPFYDDVRAFARRLAPSATVAFGGGCHDGTFFSSQRSASLDFLAGHVAV